MKNSYNPYRLTITNGLVISYVIVYILQLLVGESFSIFHFAMNTEMVVYNHEYYRVFTSEFMHAGFFHLLMNCLFIFQLGNIIEQILGKSRYIFLIFMSILFSGLGTIVSDLLTHSSSFGLGASGFGYGLIGLLAAFAILYPGRYYGNIFKQLAVNLIVYSLLFVLLHVNIGWSAHVGGFLGGMLTGLILHLFYRKPQW